MNFELQIVAARKPILPVKDQFDFCCGGELPTVDATVPQYTGCAGAKGVKFDGGIVYGPKELKGQVLTPPPLTKVEETTMLRTKLEETALTLTLTLT